MANGKHSFSSVCLQERTQRKSNYANKYTCGINLGIVTMGRNLPAFVGVLLPPGELGMNCE